MKVIWLVVGAAIIAAINLQVINTWFGKSGPANIGSIEVSYVTMAKFWRESGGRTWQPDWYLGYPMNLNYVPIVPMGIATLVRIGQMDYWEAYRLLTGMAYIAAPIGLFLLVWQMGKNWVGGMISAMVYSVGPTVFYWLDSGVAGDKFSASFWDPRRFTLLVRWGEGPHVVALVWVTLVGWCLARYIENRRRRWLVATMMMLAMAGLTNALGLFAAIFLVLVMMFVKLAQEKDAKIKVFADGVAVMAGAIGLLAFWYNLSFVKTFFSEGGGLVNRALSLFPWGILVVLGLVFGVYWGISKWGKDFGITVALFFSAIFVVVVGVYYKAGTELLPQALRYNTEADMGIAMLAGVVFARIAKGKNSAVRQISSILGMFIVGVFILYAQAFVPTANEAAGHAVNLYTTGEKLVADWLKSHVDSKSGERVWVTGNHGFYLNYFNDIPQVRGALYQASQNSWPDDVHYQLINGFDSDTTLAWLQVLGVRYVVLPGPGSPELYKEHIVNPVKFASMPLVEEFGGNKAYEVPNPKPGLAHVVNGTRLAGLAPIRKADDKRLLAYQQVIEASSDNTVQLIVLDKQSYQLTVNSKEGEKVVVATTYDLGWQAIDVNTAKGLQITHDPLGFIVVTPVAGQTTISLTHHTTWDVYMGYVITVLTMVGIGWICLQKTP